jgi:hypothetical protein
VDASASAAFALVLAFFEATAVVDPLLPMAAVRGQERLQNESRNM